METINLCRFTDSDTAEQTIQEIDADTIISTALAHGVTLHTGTRYGAGTIVLKLDGTDSLNIVISPAGFDD